MSCKKYKLSKETREKIIKCAHNLKAASNLLFNGHGLDQSWKREFDEARQLFDKILLESCEQDEEK